MTSRLSALAAALPISLSAGLLVAASSAWGQGDASPSTPTVVVTGARQALPAEQMAADVVVITRSRTEASLADSLEDLLRREAGVQLARSGGPGASAGLLLRGASSGQTLVLVDGVRIGAATAGLAEFEALSLQNVERVEVLRGPASSLYGADAVGGVVQIFTRGGAASGWALRGAIGGLGAREASAHGTLKADAFTWNAGAAYETARGVSALRPGDTFGNYNPDNDGYTRRSAVLSALWQLTPEQRLQARWNTARLNAQYDGAEYPPPTFAPDPSPDFRNRVEIGSMLLRHEARWAPAWSSQVQLSRQESDGRQGGRTADRFATQRNELRAQLSWNGTQALGVTLAAESLREKVQSSVYLADASRDNDALVLATNLRGAGIDGQAEVRRDENSVYGGVTTGRLGASWALAPGWRLRALWGSTFRAPSFNDLVYPDYGVPTIGPERGRSVEIGLNWQQGTWQGQATVYRNRVRGLIAYEPDARRCPPRPEYAFGCARNIGQSQLQGASLGARWQHGPWTVRGVLDWLDAKDRQTGARLARRAAHQQFLSATWREAAWQLGAELVRVGARPESGRLLAAYTTVDLKAQWQPQPTWALELRLANAGNTDVEPARDYRGQPRQAWLVWRWSGV